GSHPQCGKDDGEIHPDTPGMARAYLEDEEGVAQIYFTGCGGDVTAGKYNDGTPGNRVRLSKQLYSGMIRAIAATRRVPVREFSWKSVDVVFPTRTEPQFSKELLQKAMSDPAQKASRRLTSAIALAWMDRLSSRP